jgi:hypothetical protein
MQLGLDCVAQLVGRRVRQVLETGSNFSVKLVYTLTLQIVILCEGGRSQLLSTTPTEVQDFTVVLQSLREGTKCLDVFPQNGQLGCCLGRQLLDFPVGTVCGWRRVNDAPTIQGLGY